MVVGFRLDANENIATGHMFRCITIAKALIESSVEICFYIAEDKYTDILRRELIPYKVIHGHWNNYDLDIEVMLKYVSDDSLDVLVVDSYQVTEKFLSAMHKLTAVFLIDDICKKIYDVDTVLHYSEWEGNYIVEKLYRGTNVHTLYGLKYVPLREEFSRTFPVSDKKQILITTGGTDNFHLSIDIADILLNITELKNYDICVVCGKGNGDFGRLNELAKAEPRLLVKCNVTNMAEIMNQSAFAFSAGGITIYELCAMQCPIISISISDDQKAFLEEMQKQGMLIYLGDIRDDSDDIYKSICYATHKILDKDTAKNIKMRMSMLIDGKGANRISQEIMLMIGKALTG